MRLTVKGKVSKLDTVDHGRPEETRLHRRRCEIKAGTSPSLEGVAVGTEVEMGCGLVDGKMTLLKLKKHR